MPDPVVTLRAANGGDLAFLSELASHEMVAPFLMPGAAARGGSKRGEAHEPLSPTVPVAPVSNSTTREAIGDARP